MDLGVPSVTAMLGASVKDFWRERLAQHTLDTYRGRALAKFPEDLRTYQHIIERSRPDLVIELGTYDGGSAIWFADQLDTLARGGDVITIDINAPRPMTDPRVQILTGSLHERRIVDAVKERTPGRRVMVVDDSGHTPETTRDALVNYAPFVSHGCWFVVEDGVVDEPELSIWPNVSGVQGAIEQFLATDSGLRFEQHHLAPYGLTTCHYGWLEARGDR